MSIFKFEDKEVVRKKSVLRNPKVIFGVALLIAIPAIGNTLASSITVGTANRVEFGQGLTQAVACDSAITVMPKAGFVNHAGVTDATPPPVFNLGSIVVGGIADACDGKYFTIKVFGDTSSTALTIASPSPSSSPAATDAVTVLFHSNATAEIKAGSNTNATISSSSNSSDASTFTVSLATALAASSVYKITVETSDA